MRDHGLVWSYRANGQFDAVAVDADPTLAPVGSTAETATMRYEVDGNANVVRRIDATDNGAPHDGRGGRADTADPTVAQAQRGDPEVTLRDGFDRVVEVEDAMGYRSRLAWDPDSNVVSSARIGPSGGNLAGGGADDRLLSRVDYEYDELSRMVARRTSYFRDPQPLAKPKIEDVYADVYSYDRASRLVRLTRPLGDFDEHLYDGAHRQVETRSNPLTGPKGTLVVGEVHRRFDDANNLVQVHEIERSVEDGRSESFYTDTFYDAANRPVLSISNHFAGSLDANAYRMAWDSAYQVIVMEDPAGSDSTKLSLDRGGPVTVNINTGGNGHLRVYDGLGRLVTSVSELHVDHDGDQPLDMGNAANADGLVINHREWDLNSRLIGTTDDVDTGAAMGVLNPSTTRFEYDTLDRVVARLLADETRDVWVLDGDSHRVQMIDANGTVLDYGRDDLGRLTTVRSAPAVGVEPVSLAFEYDGLSRQTMSRDFGSELVDARVTRRFDSLGRSLEEGQEDVLGTAPGGLRLVGSEYDANGNVVQVIYPGSIRGAGRRSVTYGLKDVNGETLNRVEWIEEGAGVRVGGDLLPTFDAALQIARYTYIGQTREDQRQYGNPIDGSGPLTTRIWDALRRQTGVVHHSLNLGGNFADFETAYDRLGNTVVERAAHEVPAVSDVYRYDSLSRVVGESLGTMESTVGIANNQVANPPIPATALRERSWTLDGAGNWLEIVQNGFPFLSPAVNEMNAYFQAGDGRRRAHDNNGNLTQDANVSYMWDALNRLTRVKRNSDGQLLARYGYDAEGRRVRESRFDETSGTFDEVVLSYRNGQVVQEDHDVAPGAMRQFVWGPRGLRQFVDNFSPYAFLPFNTHENRIGSLMMTTGHGAEFIANNRHYDAFGTLVENGGGLEAVLPYGLAGTRTDVTTNHYWIAGGATLFDPFLGRSITRTHGPLLNHYAWGGNNLIASVAAPGPSQLAVACVACFPCAISHCSEIDVGLGPAFNNPAEGGPLTLGWSGPVRIGGRMLGTGPGPSADDPVTVTPDGATGAAPTPPAPTPPAPTPEPKPEDTGPDPRDYLSPDGRYGSKEYPYGGKLGGCKCLLCRIHNFDGWLIDEVFDWGTSWLRMPLPLGDLDDPCLGTHPGIGPGAAGRPPRRGGLGGCFSPMPFPMY